MIVYEDSDVVIRTMREADIDFFADKFLELNWGNRKEILTLYFAEQKNHTRDVLVAVHHGTPVGYITLISNTVDGPFANKGLPEIKDFNVLPSHRRLGIGTRLMECIESIAKTKSKQITLGVGLYSDYGAAQRMYVKRGYIPDGSGLWHGNRNLMPYENCINDDNLTLYFIKEFTSSIK
jgi:GNAT superfamily N-acetyltransferase